MFRIPLKIVFILFLPILTACGGPGNPENNFEQFWETFNTHYTNFELRGVDWQQQYDAYRPMVTSNTSERELFAILSDMVRPLRDGHVTISGNNNSFSAGEGTLYIDQEFRGQNIESLFELSERTLKQAGFNDFKMSGSLLRHGQSDEVGYLRVLELEGESDRAIRLQLNDIMSGFNDLSGVIVDIRSNPGGEDEMAFAIANRFTDIRRLAHTKTTQTSPGKFTAPREFYLEPSSNNNFTGPVVLLTNDASASAADVMALIMKQIPSVTIVGDRTEGIFSDIFDASLSNGWDFTLSNQRYFSPQGINYEMLGVPPDILVRNTVADLNSGADPVIDKALEVLSLQ